MLCDMSWKNNVLLSGNSYRLYNKEHGGHAKSTSWKVVGSNPDGVIGIFHLHNPFGLTLALGSTQPLTKMSTRDISCRVKAVGA
jgi:hypothetical protein